MGLIQTSRQSTGGGGGLTIIGWADDQFPQTENFEADTLTLELSQTPVDPNAIALWYNGQVKQPGVDWEYVAPNFINILFADLYVTDYSETPYFEAIYPY